MIKNGIDKVLSKINESQVVNEAYKDVKPNGKKVSANEYRRDWFSYQDKHYKHGMGNVSIEEMPRYGEVSQGFGVNWSAIGTVDTSEAQEFIKELNSALKDVELLNKKYLGVTLVYDD